MFSRTALSALRVTLRATGPIAGRRALMSTYSQANSQSNNSKRMFRIGGFTLIAAGALGAAANPLLAASATPDYQAIRAEIAKLIDSDKSVGPLLIRLAWHASGTYDKHSKTGGSNGATMRFDPEAKHGANAGLGAARALLDKLKQKYPEVYYSDLWTLAGVVAVEELGGPKVNWRPGRVDKPDGSQCTPDGRLPAADQGHPKITTQHVRDIFHRMGFTDQEIVALAGAHAVGRCHTDRSGYSGPWTFDEFSFTNDYFVQLLTNTWTKKKWNGPEQYEDPTGKIMMLPADMAFVQDPEFKKYVELYAKDQERFFKDFSKAFQKLLELGVPSQGWFSWLWGK